MKQTSYIACLGTGGTIAGRAVGGDDLTNYASGALDVEEVFEDLPEVAMQGPFYMESISHIDSSNMTEALWLLLAKRVEAYVCRDDVAGVVIMHGTDTLEETAFFLHATVTTNKPVLLVGAMRPATALSADGPLNLLDAMKYIRSGMAPAGVYVAMHRYVYHPVSVMKQHAVDVDAFASAFGGPIAVWQGNQCIPLTQTLPREHIAWYSHENIQALPKVGMLYTHVGLQEDMVRCIVENAYEGLVVLGMGNGTISTMVRGILEKSTLFKVRASRISKGMIMEEVRDIENGWIASGRLMGVKARIALSLAIVRAKNEGSLTIETVRAFMKELEAV